MRLQAFAFPFVAALIGWTTAAQAQDPCAALAQHGGALIGEPGAKPKAVKSGKNTICELRNGDNSAHLSLVAAPTPQPASTLAFSATMARQSKEPGRSVKDEPSLGTGAFQLRDQQQLSFYAGSKGVLYSLTLNRDRGIGAGDEERLRALARQLVEGR